MNKKSYIFCAYLIILCFLAHAQEVRFPVTNYTTRDYGRSQETTCWAITQDHRGVVYVGNASVVMEFDNKNWNYIRLNKPVWVLSLATGKDGTVYVGAQYDFGLLKPDKTGQLKYRSLADSLPEENKFFSNIRFVHAGKNEVYFQAEEEIIILTNNELSVFYPDISYHKSFLVNNTFYVREREKGLMKYHDGNFKLVTGSEMFGTSVIFAMMPLDTVSDKCLVATYNQGLYMFDPAKKDSPFEKIFSPDEKILTNIGIIGGKKTEHGNFVLSTLQNGLFVINKNGQILHRINTKTGLKSNEIKSLALGNGNNLWLSSGNGISYVNITSPISFYGDNSGIEGNVHTITKFNNKLFIGTSRGLTVENKDFSSSDKNQFSKISGISQQVFNAFPVNNSLIIGTESGIFSYQQGNLAKMMDFNARAACHVPEKNWYLAGGNKGLVLLSTNNWQKLIDFEKINGGIIGIACNKADGENTEIWLGTRNQKVIRILLNNDLSYRLDKYNKNDGLMQGWIMPYNYSDSILFATPAGAMGFIDEEQMKATLPDSLKNDEAFVRGMFGFIPIKDSVISFALHAFEETNSKIWYTRDTRITCYDKNSGEHISRPFNSIDQGKTTTFFTDNENITWIGTSEGIIRYDEKINKNYELPFHVLIRNTKTNNDSILFSGTFFNEKTGKTGFSQPQTLVPELPYALNSIAFDFTALYFKTSQNLAYSYKLKGYDDKWSKWDPTDFVSYTNLHEGDYTFIVKAKNVYNIESQTVEYAFSILPPWYRTGWAYVLYVVAFLLILYAGIQISIRRLKAKNEKLEAIVKERTAEIQRQNVKLEKQRDEIKHQKDEITDSIVYAKKIQEAMLPPKEQLDNSLPDHFVLFKPRDIVSGDFYWMKQFGNKVVITAADCTGHGVPGAFMSMLGMSFLNEIVTSANKDANIILDELRDKVKTSLRQTGKEAEQKDGMDIALCIIDFDTMKLQFSGAYNPLYLIRDSEIMQFKADRQPIAVFLRETPFTKHEIELQKGDVLYIFSDGYADQFGGEMAKKLMSKGFRKVLMAMYDKPMKEQKDLLDREFENWRQEIEQMDDVILIGIKA
jgi:serine phosphatase RsbU (regulator of sigma subunit)